MEQQNPKHTTSWMPRLCESYPANPILSTQSRDLAADGAEVTKYFLALHHHHHHHHHHPHCHAHHDDGHHPGILLVAVVAKYVLHWRYTQLALHVPTLATLLYIW